MITSWPTGVLERLAWWIAPNFDPPTTWWYTSGWWWFTQILWLNIYPLTSWGRLVVAVCTDILTSYYRIRFQLPCGPLVVVRGLRGYCDLHKYVDSILIVWPGGGPLVVVSVVTKYFDPILILWWPCCPLVVVSGAHCNCGPIFILWPPGGPQVAASDSLIFRSNMYPPTTLLPSRHC